MTDRRLQRLWTADDAQLVDAAIWNHTPIETSRDLDRATTAVLDALTAAGWRPRPRTRFDEIDSVVDALGAREDRATRLRKAEAEVERLRVELETKSVVHQCCEDAETLRARLADLEQTLAAETDPLIARLIEAAHRWHAAYEAETSPTALADSPGYRQARVALSDAVYRLINDGRLPEHGSGWTKTPTPPSEPTPPETAGGEHA